MTTAYMANAHLVPKISSTALPTTPADEWAGELSDLLRSHVTLTPSAKLTGGFDLSTSSRPGMGRSMSSDSVGLSLRRSKADCGPINPSLSLPWMLPRRDSGLVDPAHNPQPQRDSTNASTTVHTGHSSSPIPSSVLPRPTSVLVPSHPGASLDHGDSSNASTAVHTGHSSSAVAPAIPRPTSGLIPSHPGVSSATVSRSTSNTSFPRQYTESSARFVDSPAPGSLSFASAIIDPSSHMGSKPLVQCPVPLSSQIQSSIDSPSLPRPATPERQEHELAPPVTSDASTPCLVSPVPPGQSEMSLGDSGYAASSESGRMSTRTPSLLPSELHTVPNPLANRTFCIQGSAALNSTRLIDTIPTSDLPSEVTSSEAFQHARLEDFVPQSHLQPTLDRSESSRSLGLEDVVRLGPLPSAPIPSRRSSSSSSGSSSGHRVRLAGVGARVDLLPSTNSTGAGPRVPGLRGSGTAAAEDTLREPSSVSPEHSSGSSGSSTARPRNSASPPTADPPAHSPSTAAVHVDEQPEADEPNAKRERRRSVLGLSGLGLVQKIKGKIGGGPEKDEAGAA
ncbi:hypothetical protein C8F01DRAFT_638856 [Mycena amicta]|nr:hypothetical protein C8F01DRAFT_638856 [Mycena amicta]